MSSFATLATSVSGLRAAQAGLYVTGHNMSNSPVAGYVRQRADQTEFMQQTIGNNGIGVLQRGLGTDISQIKQIRDKFIDISYRQEVSKYGYYSVKATVGLEIQTILGELQSSYNAQSIINDMWLALNELSDYQSGQETRANFISTAVAFITKANNVSERLYEYQLNLDQQIRDAVTEVNKLLTKIKTMNERIVDAEIAGDNANDYRDERNRALDQLSEYLNIDYKEMPGGRVDIFCEGNLLLTNNTPNYLSLKYCGPNSSFVEPVLTGSARTNILAYDTSPDSYYSLINLNGSISSELGNDSGIIKGLMVARGYFAANYTSANPVAPTAPAVVAKPDAGPFIDALTDPNGSAYTHTAGDADVATFLQDYADYLEQYNAYVSDYNKHKKNPELYPAPAGIAPEPPDLPTNTSGFDPNFLSDYNDYLAEYNGAYTTDYNAYAADYPVQQAEYATYLKDKAQYAVDYDQYKKAVANIELCMIPNVQYEFDTIVHAIITLINDAVSPYLSATGEKDPDAPYGMDGSQYTEVFVRKYPPYSSRFDENGIYIEEDPTDQYSLYTIGNIMVNPDMLNTDGYNLLALMPNMVDIDDTTLVLGLMETWKSEFISFKGNSELSVDDAYKQFIGNIANETDEAIRFSEEQSVLIAQIENKRQAISGVSLDEEMTFMLKYQHAYNASARMITQIDDMLDRVINKMGRVGL